MTQHHTTILREPDGVIVRTTRTTRTDRRLRLIAAGAGTVAALGAAVLVPSPGQTRRSAPQPRGGLRLVAL